MAMVRYDPIRELDPFQGDITRLFQRFFERPGDGGGGQRWIPAMDLVEKDDHLELRADLPGMSEDDVDVEVRDGVLTISGERRQEEEETREGFRRIERAFGRFTRSIALPDGVDPNDVEANFEDGVLTVRIPKPRESEPTHVQVGQGRSQENGRQGEGQQR
jgi:HSP20 family protein